MKKHVYYTSYFEVPQRYLTNSGRLKLADFRALIAEASAKACDNALHLEPINVEVSEVLKGNCKLYKSNIYDSSMRIYAKVVVEMEIERFPHVRKFVLRRFSNQAVNYMPKLACEHAIFLLFREVGLRMNDEDFDVYEFPIKITIQDGNYREDVLYKVVPSTTYYSPRNMIEYMRFMDTHFEKQKFEFD